MTQSKYSIFKSKVYKIINQDREFSFLSKIFDIFIITLILLNVAIVIADTFKGLPTDIRTIFLYFEVVSVIIFSIEYILRLWTSDLMFAELKPFKARLKYVLTFMAIIDLLAILPFFIPFILPTDLRVLRILRILRLMRLFKFNRYTTAFRTMGKILKKKSSQLISSMIVVLLLMIIASILMYNIENIAQPDKFENAFSSMWWAISAFTTIGYGDIYPITVLGKILSSIIAFLSIGLVALPAGIISAGFIEHIESETKETKCKRNFCQFCGERLE